MNKLVKSLVILAVVAIAFGSASAVFAQSGPNTGLSSRTGRGGRGGGGGGGTMLGEANSVRLQDGFQDGLLHDAMIAAFADALGLSVDKLNTRLEAGETMADIAISTGLTLEDFRDLMVEVRTLVYDQAVADGTLTEEQAEWLKSRGSGRYMNGGMGMNTGFRGNGQGMYRTGECIND